MAIEIIRTSIQFKNPVIGQPTRAVEEHYYARRIVTLVDIEEKQFRFMASELPFVADEEKMIKEIEQQVSKQNAE